MEQHKGPKSERSKIRRSARADYDPASVRSILAEGLVAHVGFHTVSGPCVIPMFYVHFDDTIFLHGAVATRVLGLVDADLAVTVTLLDGLVLARSAFHHSMNYRSVVAFGKSHEVTDRAVKRRVFDAMVERMSPGRLSQLRPMHDKELAATRVIALPIDEASAKARSGGPIDDEEDLATPVWAGVIPLAVAATGCLFDRDSDRFAKPSLPPGVAPGRQAEIAFADS